MVGGDLSFIGEKGLNLSGGQRARLALARAIYCDSDIYMFDDILSSVDAHVACWILHNAIMGPLLAEKTRILCTHNVQWIFLSLLRAIHFLEHMTNGVAAAVRLLMMTSSSTGIHHKILIFAIVSLLAISSADMVVVMDKGNVRWAGSFADFSESSYAAISSMESLKDSSQSLQKNSVNSLTESKPDHAQEGDNIGILEEPQEAIEIEQRKEGTVELSVYKAFSFAFGGLRAAVQVHTELLNKLINAPITFFDQNPSGRILNRFSSDLYTIDDSLPFILNILLAHFLDVIIIMFYYRCTARELRRLDSVSRSPIYASFTETLDGSSTIRAFKLELIAAFINSFIAIMAVVGNQGGLPVNFSTPGLVGLALSYASPIVSIMSSFLTSFTETEKEMVSVERVLEYMDIPQEELCGCNSLNPDWPSQGHVKFEHVTLRYVPSLPAALHDVSFNIEAGMQVGIVGRTGAGKSSVINALFRLTPICSGNILIDGVNVADVAVRYLRSCLSVVPQSPFLFDGPLRDNLDPLRTMSDAKIWEALEKCHVKEEVQAAGGLDIHVKGAGASFSVGQQQLICLARALLRSSKILCLDECTASVDTRTASILQNTISSECKGMTVITIAHRISVVKKMDNVLVLDHGVLVEQGKPAVLLQNQFSKFAGLAQASTM
ncbi:hypothetical protein ACLOJK_028032 [Asimina triloba]